MKAWAAIALLGFAGAATAALASSGAAASSTGGGDVPPSVGPWKDADAPRRIRAIAAPIEAELAWPGLGDFLVAVAWIESRGNPNAGADADNNAARGWFGMRPKSAKLADRGLEVSALKSERLAVALAADYAHRLRKWWDPERIDWLALRRGWGYPKDVKKWNTEIAVPNFRKGVTAAGLPLAWMQELAFTPDYDWPGFARVVELAKGAAL